MSIPHSQTALALEPAVNRFIPIKSRAGVADVPGRQTLPLIMSKNRLLIADADAKAWDEFRQALGESWTVVGAGSDGAALAEAQKQPFDVVVANYELPGAGGGELLNRLRIDNPKTLRF